MKSLILNISAYIGAELLQDASSYSERYYKIESCDRACCLWYPVDIIQELYHEDDDYFEYTLGYFEEEKHGGDFVGVFTWKSDYGADSIFGDF